jgi:hypothetical protein
MKPENPKSKYGFRRALWLVMGVGVPGATIYAVEHGNPPHGVGLLMIGATCIGGLALIYEALRKRPKTSSR